MESLSGCLLFRQMDGEEIRQCLHCSKSRTAVYKKEEILFHTGEIPQRLYILLKGSVAVCRDSAWGKRMIVNSFQKPGDLFGEVFLFLTDMDYPNYTVAQKNSRILEIPKEYFYHTCGDTCEYHAKMIRNMLSILAEKAYLLNRKLQLVSGTSLRQKIVRILLDRCGPGDAVTLDMNREALADFLGSTRPSLSREMMKMQEEGLIAVKGNHIRLLDLDMLEAYL